MDRRSIAKTAVLVVAMVAALGFLATPVRAVQITPTDFDTLGGLGTLVWESSAGIYNGGFNGTLKGWVYDNAGTYTYKLLLEPTVTGVLQFGTSFVVSGFTGVAGYSFGEAAAAGFVPSPAAPTAFSIYEIAGNLAWTVPNAVVESGFWDDYNPVTGYYNPITFFFQANAMGANGPFHLVRADGTYHTGEGTFAPVPEPMTLLLLVGGAAGIAAWERRRRTQR